MTNKIRNIITVTVLAITTSTIMGILVSTYTQQAAVAQYRYVCDGRQKPKTDAEEDVSQ